MKKVVTVDQRVRDLLADCLQEPHGPLKGLPDMQPFNVNGKDLNVPKSKALAQDYDDYWFTNEGGS